VSAGLSMPRWLEVRMAESDRIIAECQRLLRECWRELARMRAALRGTK
jgi:uncharacterized coiled-coil protein SlyX